MNKPLLLKLINFIKQHKPETLVMLGIVLYCAYFITATFLKYDNFYTGRYDLGNMDQVVWNTSHGRIFQASGDSGETISRLSSHADFILIAIAPLYKMWADPRLLLLIQVLVLAVGAIFIYKIAKMILGNKNAGAIFALLYLLNPAIQYTNLYDFHPVTLATTLLLATFYFFLKKHYLLFILFAFLSAMTKEQVWIIIGLFGFYIIGFELFKMLKEKKKSDHKRTLKTIVFGVLISTVCFSIFFYLVSVLIPQVRGGEHFALSYYANFGNSPESVIKNVAFSPGKVFNTFILNQSYKYIFELFFPLGFLSFFAPIALLFAVPDLGIDLLSSDKNLHQIYYQYSATITPFVFVSAIFAISNLKKWFPRQQILKLALCFITITTLISAYSYGPLPGAKHPSTDMFTKPLADRKLIQAFVNGVPTKYTIAATNNLGSHLSRREHIYTIPVGIENADIILFLLNDPFAQPSLNEQKKMVQDLKNNEKYLLLFEKGDFVVFQKASLIYKNKLF